MATRLIPGFFRVTDYTQAEEDTFAASLSGQRYGAAFIYNTDLDVPRLWNGTAFESQPDYPSTLIDGAGGSDPGLLYAFTHRQTLA